MKNRISRLAGLSILLIALAVTLPAAAQSTDEPPQKTETSSAKCDSVSYDTHTTNTEITEFASLIAPPNPDGETIVDVGLYILRIYDISEVNGTYSLEGYLNLVWCDPRLAFEAPNPNTPFQYYLDSYAAAKYNEIWNPDVQFYNNASSVTTENQEIKIHTDGSVEYTEQFRVTLVNPFDLHNFPFDTQTLRIEIQSFAWTVDHMLFHEDQRLIDYSDDFELTEWDITSQTSELGNQQDARDRAPYSELLVTLDVKRHSNYFLWNGMVPLFILVMISWTGLWINRTNIEFRISSALTAILTIVAFKFTFAGSLPRISYFTYLDLFFIYSFMLVTISIIHSVFIRLWEQNDQSALAEKVDTASKWAYPLIYIAGLILIWFLQK